MSRSAATTQGKDWRGYLFVAPATLYLGVFALLPMAVAAYLSVHRWPLLRALTGAGPVGVRELARRLGRDAKGTHTDTQALVKAGVIEKTADGKLHFPYEAVRIELGWRAAA